MSDFINRYQGNRLPYLMIMALVSIGFLLIIPVSGAETLKVISNTDICKYRAGIKMDYCKTVYELCDPDLDMKKVDFKFKFEGDKSLKSYIDDLSYTYSSSITKTNCREITIEGYKNPFKNVDNILCYDSKCHEEFVWWNTSFTSKFAINGSINAGEFTMPLLLNDSFIIINDFRQIVWCNYSINNISQFIGYFYFRNESFYRCVDRTETFAVEMDVDEGNGTDTGNPYDLDTVLVMHMRDPIVDSSTYEQTSTPDVGIDNITGFIGGAQNFTRANQEIISVFDDISMRTVAGGGMTYMAWINPIDFPTTVEFIAKGHADSRIQLGTRPTGGDDDRLWAYIQGESDSVFIPSLDGCVSLPTGTWSHIGVTINLSGNGQVYYNGEVCGAAVSLAGIGTMDQTGNMGIGGLYNDASGWLNGMMDEVRVYNRTLSPDEFRAIYENQNGTFGITQPGPLIELQNVSVKHFDIGVPSFIITSQQYQTIINDTFTLVNPVNLIIKGSGGAMKEGGGGATTLVSSRLIFNGITLYDQTIRSVRGTSDRGVFTLPITNATGQGGTNRFILQMKRTGIDDINISNLGFHLDTDVSDNDFVIENLLETVSINYTSTSYVNIANFTINKTTNSAVLIDVDHRFESTSNNIIGECFFESEQTGERTLTYSRWLQFSGNVGSSGINHRSQIFFNGNETWLMFCRSSSNNLMLNNITVFIMNQQNNINETIQGFQNDSSISGLTGTGNILLSSDHANAAGPQLEILTTIIMQSTSGAQDGSNSPFFTIRTNDSVCNTSIERSLVSNSDIGTAKLYLNCGNIIIDVNNNYEVLVDVAGGETLNILNVSISTYETTPQLVIEGIVPPTVRIINPVNASVVSETIDIESVVIDLSRTGWASIIVIINASGDMVFNVLNETAFGNTTSITFNTRLLDNGNYTIEWIVSNNQGNNSDNVTIFISNIIIPIPPTITFCVTGELLLLRESIRTLSNGSDDTEITESFIFCHYGCSNNTLTNWGSPGCIESDYTLSLILIAVVLISVFSIRRIL